MMQYKGYKGSFDYSEEDKVYYGKIECVCDLVAYVGDTRSDLRKSFEKAVDDYIKMIEEIKKQ